MNKYFSNLFPTVQAWKYASSILPSLDTVTGISQSVLHMSKLLTSVSPPIPSYISQISELKTFDPYKASMPFDYLGISQLASSLTLAQDVLQPLANCLGAMSISSATLDACKAIRGFQIETQALTAGLPLGTISHDDIGKRFLELSGAFVDEVSSNSDPDTISTYSDLTETFLAPNSEKRLSVADICAIIMLLLTLFAFARDTMPNSQLSHIETILQETVETGQQIIELKERELEAQLQQLEESREQTRLLKDLSKTSSQDEE